MAGKPTQGPRPDGGPALAGKVVRAAQPAAAARRIAGKAAGASRAGGASGERHLPNDLMAWNADGTRLPYRTHSEYLHRLFLRNDLFEGRYLARGRPVTLSDIRGSWWPAWQAWLAQRSSGRGALLPLGAPAHGYPALADAPGTYVLQR
jgi:poly(3-hydroxyalkanoate) synthetase